MIQVTGTDEFVNSEQDTTHEFKLFAHVYVCMNVCVHVCVCVCVRARVCVYVCMYVNERVCVCIYIWRSEVDLRSLPSLYIEAGSLT